jgi:ubiquinone/menaquinone biosynthesis C-methylase UbiE
VVRPPGLGPTTSEATAECSPERPTCPYPRSPASVDGGTAGGRYTPGVSDVTPANAEFWSEPCGTVLARSIGIEEITADALRRYDVAYFEYYPYLIPLVERAGIRGATVLEIGLGFGTVGQYVAQQAKEYHGIDIAEEPVGLLEQRLATLDHAAPSTVRQGSALDLPYPTQSFDTVITIGTLHHTGDLIRAVTEVHRVLRPGGRALVMLYNRNSFRRIVRLPRLRVAARLGRLDMPVDQRIRGMYDHRSDGRVAPHTDFISVGDARRLFAAFADVRVERRNFDEYRILRLRLKREWFIGSLDRLLGLDLYITAVK